MEVEVLMSTMNKKNIAELNLTQKKINDSALIVNQGVISEKPEITESIKMINTSELGLSKSRNALIRNASKEIGIITDDDISFIADYKEKLTHFYNKYPKADIITFNTKIGEKIKGPNQLKKHSLYSLMSIASCQISFKTKSVKEKKIIFDERFGLGAKYKAGEENIFLADALAKGLNIIHIPLVLNSHPDGATTGEKWDINLIKAKGALSYRILKHCHFLFFFYFLFFKHKLYKNNVNFFDFIKFYFIGIKEFKKEV